MNRCEHLNALLSAETKIIKKHLDNHKWFQHILDDNSGVADFVGKYGFIMREMYCGFVCKDRESCELAKEYLDNINKNEEKIS